MVLKTRESVRYTEKKGDTQVQNTEIHQATTAQHARSTENLERSRMQNTWDTVELKKNTKKSKIQKNIRMETEKGDNGTS